MWGIPARLPGHLQRSKVKFWRTRRNCYAIRLFPKLFDFGYLSTLLQSRTTDYITSNGSVTVNDEQREIWKEIVVVNFKAYPTIYLNGVKKIVNNLPGIQPPKHGEVVVAVQLQCQY